MTDLIETAADAEVRDCLKANRSFALIAGAGSGKTTSLVEALQAIRAQSGASLRRNGQRVAVITYTKRAAKVLTMRLGFDELYLVSTLHSFLWAQFSRFPEDVRQALHEHRIPALLEKAAEKDTGRETKEARKARDKVIRLQADLESLARVKTFTYDDTPYSDYPNGTLNHDDIIEVAGYLFQQRPVFRKLIGIRFPYIFVDEAQDTFQCIVDGINLTCANDGLPLVGYFGDPWQQIYEDRAGDFAPPANGLAITKTENFRCAKSVIRLLNAFRTDVEQYPAGPNQDVEGSVEAILVQAENPEAPRGRYSDAQIERALGRMDQALDQWGWKDRNDVIRLFLARQMIARRLGFSALNQLFTGTYASQRAQERYEEGGHYLLRPFTDVVCPLVEAHTKENGRGVIDILRRASPSFDIQGTNAHKSLRSMIDLSNTLVPQLVDAFKGGTVRDVLSFCKKHGLAKFSDKLDSDLAREPRAEDYNEDLYSEEKGDWLADDFMEMGTGELQAYSDFIQENTVYSTQHGVKGEEYPNVLVVYDDVEAAWNQYSFTKLLTPNTAGDPTEGQRERGRKLAYVSFSRAEENLRILLFTRDPTAARAELIGREMLDEAQISIIE